MRNRILVFIGFIIVPIGCDYDPEVILAYNSYVSVYPNPAIHNAYVSVKNPDNQPALLMIYDPKGEVVLDENVNTGTYTYPVSIQDRPKGMYHIVFKTASEVTTQKFVKK